MASRDSENDRLHCWCEARIQFEAVYDAILIKNIMQLARIDSQFVLVANIDRDPGGIGEDFPMY